MWNDHWSIMKQAYFIIWFSFNINFRFFIKWYSTAQKVMQRKYVKYTCSMDTVQQNGRFTLFSSKFHSDIYSILLGCKSGMSILYKVTLNYVYIPFPWRNDQLKIVKPVRDKPCLFSCIPTSLFHNNSSTNTFWKIKCIFTKARFNSSQFDQLNMNFSLFLFSINVI